MSVLLSLTNNIMSKCATITNDFTTVEAKAKTKSRKVPKVIKNAKGKLISAHKKYKLSEKSPRSYHDQVQYSKTVFICNKKKYRQALRQHMLRESLERFKKRDDISVNPTSAYSYLRSCMK